MVRIVLTLRNCCSPQIMPFFCNAISSKSSEHNVDVAQHKPFFMQSPTYTSNQSKSTNCQTLLQCDCCLPGCFMFVTIAWVTCHPRNCVSPWTAYQRLKWTYGKIAKWPSTRPWMTSIQDNSKLEWRKWPLKPLYICIWMQSCLSCYSVSENWHTFVQ